MTHFDPFRLHGKKHFCVNKSPQKNRIDFPIKVRLNIDIASVDSHVSVTWHMEEKARIIFDDFSKSVYRYNARTAFCVPPCPPPSPHPPWICHATALAKDWPYSVRGDHLRVQSVRVHRFSDPASSFGRTLDCPLNSSLDLPRYVLPQKTTIF